MTIKELRKKTGMSQSAFAAYFDISVRNIQEWEQGRRTPPPYVVSMMNRIINLENGLKRRNLEMLKEKINGESEQLLNLSKNCRVGSMAWLSNIEKVKRQNPEDFIFNTGICGNDTLSDLLSEFEDKEAVREEVIENLEHYARFDLASMYKLLKEKGFKTI